MTYLQRKKLAFMSIINRVKGFVRTVTGTPPLTLPDCVDEDSIINYTISGNSAQDGTPSPDNPIEIESVGEKTANLFDVNNPYLIGGYISNNKLLAYNVTYDSSPTVTIVLPIKSNTTYTASRKLLGKRFALATSPNAPAASIELTNYTGSNGYTAENLTITSGNDDKYLYVWFCNTNVDTYTYQELMQEIHIVEGAEVSPYEPYGYKIPIKVSGKNLIPYPYYHKFANYKGVDITYNKDGSLTLNGTHTESIVSNFTLFQKDTLKLPKGTYTMSCDGLTDTKSVYMVVSINGTYRIIYANSKYTFTFNEDTYLGAGYIQFAVGAVFDNVTVKPLIERGSEATGYEPYIEPITTNIYLNEPLRKINDYADYIDFENECVIRNTQKITFTSDKAYLYTTYGNGIRFDNVLKEGGDRYAGYCTHSKDVKMTAVAGGVWCGANTNKSVYWIGILDVLGLTTVDEFKTWLDAQEIPVEVVCEKSTAVIEPITLPKLPTFKGTTIYSIETKIQPSNMEVTYYSISKEG